TSAGTVPLQRIFDLGGLSTLHARRFKEESGNRMILANVEYIVNGDFLHDLRFWPSGLFRSINFLVLGDAGWMRTAGTDARWTEGFDGIQLSDFRSDVGFGVASRSGAFRLAFVWRTDISAPAKFIFRFNRPF
ncbi:MAG: hypothetical protein WD295_01270, partial [Bacteroidota bacterium]